MANAFHPHPPTPASTPALAPAPSDKAGDRQQLEAEYSAAFGGGQVLVELTLTLTNLGHPQQTPPLLFVDNEYAISLATSSVRPKKSKSIDMRLDWLKERAGQQFFRLVFIPGLINPADFFTKILPSTAKLTSLPYPSFTAPHTLYLLSPPLSPSPSHYIPITASVAAMQSATGTNLR